MLDSNCLDALLADPETAQELPNRPDLRLFLTEIQFDELGATPDQTRRASLLELANLLCRRLKPPSNSSSFVSPGSQTVHANDHAILESAKACDFLVSLDEGLLEQGSRLNQPCMHWESFLKRFVWRA